VHALTGRPVRRRLRGYWTIDVVIMMLSELTEFSTLRVALVHDFLHTSGGAEKVLCDLAALFPHAPIYTLTYDARTAPAALRSRTIISALPRWTHRILPALLPMLPTMPELWDLRDYDIVVSSSGAWSKGIVTRVNTAHVAYIHSPMRFVWDENMRYAQRRVGRLARSLPARAIFSRLRVWDVEAAQRPDVLVANSHYTAARIEKFYRRSATVAYPIVPLPAEFSTEPREKFFLTVARLSEYKNVELLVEVFTRLKLPLKVVGDGRLRSTLMRRAGKTVTICGRLSDAELTRLYRTARAVIFAAEEDFGLVPAEALSYGTPVIAYNRGGVREIVQPGVTGEMFDALSAPVVADGIRRFLEREESYDVKAMQSAVERFGAEQFVTTIRSAIRTALKQTRGTSSV